MAVKVYTFHITYEGLEDKVWRDIEVSSNYRLDRMGYMVLAAFDTLAYHLFEIGFNDRLYELPDEYVAPERLDMAEFKLYQLELKPGDRIQMDYDFGTTQTFWLELTGIEDMKHGQGKHYPYVVDGAGRGIIDDMPVEELALLVAQIDRNGKTDKPVYYNERVWPWDYRDFDLEIMNDLLKVMIASIERGYAPFWQQ